MVVCGDLGVKIPVEEIILFHNMTIEKYNRVHKSSLPPPRCLIR
nr:pyruvate kinase [Sodalis-like endosymbiont of Proechinophthirus fluctus]